MSVSLPCKSQFPCHFLPFSGQAPRLHVCIAPSSNASHYHLAAVDFSFFPLDYELNEDSHDADLECVYTFTS